MNRKLGIIIEEMQQVNHNTVPEVVHDWAHRLSTVAGGIVDSEPCAVAIGPNTLKPLRFIPKGSTLYASITSTEKEEK